MTTEVTEIVQGLRGLADFIEQHPEIAERLSTAHAADYSSRFYDTPDSLAAVLALEPSRIDVEAAAGPEFVWEFGGGVTFRRATSKDAIGDEVEAVTTTWRACSVDELRQRYLSAQAVA